MSVAGTFYVLDPYTNPVQRYHNDNSVVALACDYEHLKYYYDKGDGFIGTYTVEKRLKDHVSLPNWWEQYILQTYPYTSNPRTVAVETTGELR
mgnify:FL=1